MPTFGHTRSDRRRETDGAACRLCLDRAEDLEDGVPGKVDISVDRLRLVLLIRTNNEAIVGVNIASLVNSMITRA